MKTFRHAIVRPPGPTYAKGLTKAGLGAPDLTRALRQHEAYCEALEACGLSLIRLPADARFPDSTFVEDTAVLAGDMAVLARPGAPSRMGEVGSMETEIRPRFPRLMRVSPPGHLDGGDVCDADGRLFIGLSERTDEEGARQLAGFLSEAGKASEFVDIRGIPGILHLKSGMAYLGEGRLAVIGALADGPSLRGFELLRVPEGESYAANCVRVNDRVLVAGGYPRFEGRLEDLGYRPLALDVSEFRKMDGGLSCLSLRF